MGIKDTSFGVKYQKIFVGRHLLNYEKMLVETPIYIRYFVISTVLVNVMLYIELLYLTELCSFLEFFFEYLLLFIPYRFEVYP